MASNRLRCRTSTRGSEQNDICFVLHTDAAAHESHAMRAVRFSLAANLAKQSVMLRAGPGAAPLLLLPPRLPPDPPAAPLAVLGDGDDFVFSFEAAAAAAGRCWLGGGGDDLPPPLLSSEKVVDAGDARPVLGVVAWETSLEGGSPPAAQHCTRLLLPDDASACCCCGCGGGAACPVLRWETGVDGRMGVAGGIGDTEGESEDKDDEEDDEAEEAATRAPQPPTPTPLGISVAVATSSTTLKTADGLASVPPFSAPVGALELPLPLPLLLLLLSPAKDFVSIPPSSPAPLTLNELDASCFRFSSRSRRCRCSSSWRLSCSPGRTGSETSRKRSYVHETCPHAVHTTSDRVTPANTSWTNPARLRSSRHWPFSMPPFLALPLPAVPSSPPSPSPLPHPSLLPLPLLLLPNPPPPPPPFTA